MKSSGDVLCTVVEARPRGLFKVRAHDGRVFQAGLAQTGRPVVRFAAGDQVLVRPSQTDPTRARIVEKLIP